MLFIIKLRELTLGYLEENWKDWQKSFQLCTVNLGHFVLHLLLFEQDSTKQQSGIEGKKEIKYFTSNESAEELIC